MSATSEPVIIVGAGAAGLMAACRAGELGLPCVLLERKHRVGSKLLMCANGKCNVTRELEPERLLADYGAELAEFLAPAIRGFAPREVRRWFEAQGLPMMATRDGRVYPRSERAPDVVHCLTDTLRQRGVMLCLNAPVSAVTRVEGGFDVACGCVSLRAAWVLLATGGVSYPKTGSVGDGQRLAAALGHAIKPYRPGLVGVEWADAWTRENGGRTLPDAVATILIDGRAVGETRGELTCEKWGLGGSVVTNATRLISRGDFRQPELRIRAAELRAPLTVSPVRMRPLKEAMVTVGGVALDDVDPATMASRRCEGLYLAGEVLDVDGPTGGYNLTAAFATGRLAIEAMAARCGLRVTRGAGRDAGGGPAARDRRGVGRRPETDGRRATGRPARAPGTRHGIKRRP